MASWKDAGVLGLLLFGLTQAAAGQPSVITAVMFARGRVVVEIASKPEEQVKGLSGRDALDPDHGMLFLYPDSQPREFWMKDTKIPLQIAFLDEKGTVLNIETGIPMDEKHLFSKGKARYALEVNRGWFEKNGVKPGDRARFVWSSSEVEGVVVAGRKLTVETVTTPEAIERGLMHRDKLPDDHGMLFVFPVPRVLSFWMKNTRLPLSIAFLDTERRVLNVAEMEAFDVKTRHRSKGPALYALEANRGWFEKSGVKRGDPVTFLRRSRERIESPGGGAR